MDEDARVARLNVRVSPRARSESVGPFSEDGFRVRLTAPPVGGKANTALVRLLAKRLGVASGRVRIVRGLASPRKTVEVLGVTTDEALRRLRRAR